MERNLSGEFQQILIVNDDVVIFGDISKGWYEMEHPIDAFRVCNELLHTQSMVPTTL